MMKKIFIFLLTAFSVGVQGQTIKIAAAANLRLAMEEIKTRYIAANPDGRIELTFGASGALAQQIINGADFDLFMAADREFPDKLKAMGMVSGEVHVYALGKLIIWSNTLDVSKGMDILAGKLIKHIAVAQPELAPYGDRAVECLKHYHLYDKVKDKLVYAGNVAQAAQFAKTGNAEVGFLAYALIVAPNMKGSYFVPDAQSYRPVEQALVLIKKRKSNPETTMFMNYVLSPACKTDFEKFGYSVR
ncbi:MAG: molybdate ABC transporter substrate-binding protein [Prolixibacteraceae bacterium]|nr:molybdate ABC transporter substrate-binding protein [Prolixibacteraceae bacterium]